jgi:hypothetical protein
MEKGFDRSSLFLMPAADPAENTLNPNDAAAWFNNCFFLAKQGKYAKTVKAFVSLSVQKCSIQVDKKRNRLKPSGSYVID